MTFESALKTTILFLCMFALSAGFWSQAEAQVDSLFWRPDSLSSRGNLFVIGREPTEKTEPLNVETEFTEKLQSRLDGYALPRIEYGNNWGIDASRYVLEENSIVIASGKRTDRYALFVLKHELGHWIHLKVLSDSARTVFLREFRDDQHLATYLGYELERLLNDEPSILDVWLPKKLK